MDAKAKPVSRSTDSEGRKVKFGDTGDESFFKVSIPRLMNQKLTSIKFLNQKNLGVEINLKGEQRMAQLLFAKKILQSVVGNN